MTSLQPRPPYSAEELGRLYPQNLELQQVQVLLRHGERSHINPRFQNAGLSPYWPYCGAAKAIRSVILEADGTLDTLTWTRKLEHLGSNDTPTTSSGPNGELDGICKLGELTDRGRETTLGLGERLRKLYVDQLGFLPAWMDDKARCNIKLRSTPIQRALESVQQTFIGLYPIGQRAPGLLPPTITQRLPKDETLVPNEVVCKRFAELSAAFADRTAKLWNNSPEMQYLNKKIGKWMPKESPTIRVDGHPRLSGINDTTNVTLAHGPATKLPAEFYDPQVRANTDRICTEEWFVGYQESLEYRRLGIGGLIGDLAQHMVEHANVTGSASPAAAASAAEKEKESSSPLFKLSLAGCHDTTIASTLASLGCFRVERDQWPSFTSSIAFELFRAKDLSSAPSSSSTKSWPSKDRSWWYALFSPSASPASSAIAAREPWESMPEGQKRRLDGHYVRVRYNDAPVALPYCRAAGRHLDGDETFCTLEAFKQVADLLTPQDWKAECNANLGKSAFPAKIEPPPGVVE